LARRRKWIVLLRRLVLWPLAVALLVIVCILVWFASAGVWLYGDMAPYVAQRHGRLVEASLERSIAFGDTHLTSYYRLESSSGLQVELALRRPAESTATPLPVVVFLDGFKHGRNAVDRLGNSGDTILAVVSYPYDGERSMKPLAWAGASRKLRRTMHDTPAALMLVLDFVLQQPGVDPGRVELMGISLGSPLVCVTGALDTRFTRVWSVHGGAGYRLVLENVLGKRIRAPLLREPVIALFGLLARRIDPVDYVGRIAPRELVVISGSGDGIFPRASAELLYTSAGEPKELIWMDSEHVNPRRPELIRELVALVLARIDPS